jgi:hypothetical protein
MNVTIELEKYSLNINIPEEVIVGSRKYREIIKRGNNLLHQIIYVIKDPNNYYKEIDGNPVTLMKDKMNKIDKMFKELKS